MNKEFKAVLMQENEKMDVAQVEDKSVPKIVRLQRRLVNLNKSMENLKLLSTDMPELNALTASSMRMIDSLRTKILIEVEALGKKEAAIDAQRLYPIKCGICGHNNYFTVKEYWVSDGTPCSNCKSPL